MKTSAAGIARIRGYEDCVLTIYKDQAGLDTIGVGHLITAEDRAVPALMALFGAGLTQAQADALLALDLVPAENAVKDLVTAAITQDQFDSLVSFIFNIGVFGFSASSLLRAINAGASNSEIRTDFLKWDKVRVNGVLTESAGLKARRTDEAKFWP